MPTTSKWRSFRVSLRTSMSESDTKEFIADALGSWGGQYFPGDEENEPDARFEIKARDVVVRRYTTRGAR